MLKINYGENCQLSEISVNVGEYVQCFCTRLFKNFVTLQHETT